MNSGDDPVLTRWIRGVLEKGAGSFLTKVAEAACHADENNYLILRNALLVLRAKYPEYDAEA